MGRPHQGRRSPPDRSVTTRPSATSPATTRATRSGSSGHPMAEATPSAGIAPVRRAATSRPRPCRSEPSNRPWAEDAPAEPTAGSGPLRPAAAQRHRRRIGQSRQRGAAGTQTLGPEIEEGLPERATRRRPGPCRRPGPAPHGAGAGDRPPPSRAPVRRWCPPRRHRPRRRRPSRPVPCTDPRPGRASSWSKVGREPTMVVVRPRPARPGAGCGPAGCTRDPPRPGARLRAATTRRRPGWGTGPGTAGRPAPPGPAGSVAP